MQFRLRQINVITIRLELSELWSFSNMSRPLFTASTSEATERLDDETLHQVNMTDTLCMPDLHILGVRPNAEPINVYKCENHVKVVKTS